MIRCMESGQFYSFSSTYQRATEELWSSFGWQDVQCLFGAMDEAPGPVRRLLCIGGAGDNALALLTRRPDEVVVIDVNPAQMALVELKKVAIGLLDFEDYLNLTMGTEEKSALRLYRAIRSSLSPQSLDYLDRHQSYILAGIHSQGRLDRQFKEFREFALAEIWSRAALHSLLDAPDLATQVTFWNQGRLSQLKVWVDGFRLGPQLFQRLDHLIHRQLISQNPYLYYLFTGEPLTVAEFAHPLWDPQQYQVLKDNLSALHLVTCDLEKYLARSSHEFDFFDLSDVLEQLPKPKAHSLVELLPTHLSPHGSIVTWSLEAEPKVRMEGLERNEDLSHRLAKSTRSWFYGGFHTAQKPQRSN